MNGPLHPPPPGAATGTFLWTIPEDRSETNNSSVAAGSSRTTLALVTRPDVNAAADYNCTIAPDSSVRATVRDDDQPEGDSRCARSDTLARLAGDEAVVDLYPPREAANDDEEAAVGKNWYSSRTPSRRRDGDPSVLSIIRTQLGDKRIIMLVLASCCLFASVLIAISVVALTRNARTSTSHHSPTPGPTIGGQQARPSQAPAPTSTTATNTTATPSDVIQAIDSALSVVSDLSKLWNNTASPEYRARDWLLNVDLLRDDVVQEGTGRIIQRYLLALMYFACNGPTWDRKLANSYLLPDRSECDWTGVSCADSTETTTTTSDDSSSNNSSKSSGTDGTNADNSESEVANRYVCRLDLSYSNLSGTLPPALSHLSGLQELSLENNSLTGSIPAEWFVLDNNNNNSTRLCWLDMSHTTRWAGLYWLDLSQNNLSHTIPSNLWTMPVLRFVYLNNNRLTGWVDNGSLNISLVSPWLEDIWLFSNRLTGHIPAGFHSSATWTSSLCLTIT